jgi:predicted transcriptional regulator
MQQLNIDFYTSYNQFYIVDKGKKDLDTSEDFWNEVAHEERLSMNDGVLGIRTECYGPVKGTLIVGSAENVDIDIESFDHIVEGSIRSNSGTLQILDCPNSDVEAELPLNNGIYRVRIYSSNLDTVDGDEGDDFYTIEIWPSAVQG